MHDEGLPFKRTSYTARLILERAEAFGAEYFCATRTNRNAPDRAGSNPGAQRHGHSKSAEGLRLSTDGDGGRGRVSLQMTIYQYDGPNPTNMNPPVLVELSAIWILSMASYICP